MATEIVIISGKGGTGKTSITASFAYLAGKKAIIADCDVDAADMHLLLQPDFANKEDFYSGELAEINPEKCIGCGKCAGICRFNAIKQQEDIYEVTPLDCEGCGYCSEICPINAIEMVEQNVGNTFTSAIKTNSRMVHAALNIGAENSGKLVAEVKKKAKIIATETNKPFLLVDGSPGVGCPVVSSLSGADYVVLVTEPSVSGVHDVKRVYELVKKFQIKAGCIINKFDINNEKSIELEEFLRENQIDLLGKIDYNEILRKQ